jgi:hypothetical protein
MTGIDVKAAFEEILGTDRMHIMTLHKRHYIYFDSMPHSRFTLLRSSSVRSQLLSQCMVYTGSRDRSEHSVRQKNVNVLDQVLCQRG